ncbi:MAG TPA: class I SAM-dependent methyltransferase [Gammaproteobacteria bacterium]|nr:class I SAM-dependent methyltransferase [Gammaproteobacteria bacterium]
MPHLRACPICDTPSEVAKLFMEESIDQAKLSGFSYASRKEPEFMCHRLVQCPACDLVYVNEPPKQDELAAAYHVAEYDSSEEADDAASAYIRAVEPVLARLPQKQRALEIGTGTGIFLEKLASAGFSELVGVEPSSAAIAAAPERRRAWIREGIFREEDFEPGSFDLICCFMTMEHVADPGSIARSAFRLLRKGGVFVTVTHDYRSLVNRVLGRRSPIIDIEHMQLFSARSIRELFVRNGYSQVEVEVFSNTYPLQYWMRLAPLPRVAKRMTVSMLAALRMNRLHFTFNVGNTCAYGFRKD